jgi:hypothetical protein
MLSPELDEAYPIIATGKLPDAKWLKTYCGEGFEPALGRYLNFSAHGDDSTAGDVAGDIAKGFAERGRYDEEAIWRRVDVAHQLRHLRRKPDDLGLGKKRMMSRQAAVSDALNSLAVCESNAGQAEGNEANSQRQAKCFARSAVAYKHMFEQATRFSCHPLLP